MSGILGRADLPVNTNRILYTVGLNKLATVSVNICNRSENEAFVYVAISTTASPLNSDYIEFNTVLPPYGILERTGIVMGENDNLIVRSETSDVSVVAYGFEDFK